MQRRYIVLGTKDWYLLPSELLNDAYDVIRMVRTMGNVRGTLTPVTVQLLFDLEHLLNATPDPQITSNEELIERDPAWRAVREHTATCLTTMGFDLHRWEMKEGLTSL